MLEGIAIGVGSAIGALILVAITALITRQWRTPKRVDRLEAVVPPMARGIFALLEYHVLGDNGNKETMKISLDELRDVTTDKMVSQRAKR
jgi:hypothetical protein